MHGKLTPSDWFVSTSGQVLRCIDVHHSTFLFAFFMTAIFLSIFSFVKYAIHDCLLIRLSVLLLTSKSFVILCLSSLLLYHVDQHMFHQFWSLKESYIKSIGIGLGLDLQSIEFHLDGSVDSSNQNFVTTGVCMILFRILLILFFYLFFYFLKIKQLKTKQFVR